MFGEAHSIQGPELTQSASSGRTHGRAQTTAAATHQACITDHISLQLKQFKNKVHSRELILIQQNIIVRRPTSSKQPSMALQIKVKLRRVCDVAVDDRAGRAIPGPVSLIRRHGEEADVVALADDDDSYLRERVDA